MSENLFGEMDASEVPDDPFYVAPDTYYCKLAEVKRVQIKNPKENGPEEGLSFKWVIEEDDSPYNGLNVQDWKAIYPNVSKDDITAEIRKDNARLKGRLLEMGVPESEMGGLLSNLEDLVGIEAYVTVVEQPDKHDENKKHTNISRIRVEE